jgi:hypothetical protein
MSKLVINTGTTPNDGTGDSLLAGAAKINSNFTEIYSSIGDGTTLGIASFTQLNVSGVSTFAGITTVTGVTLFSKQLNVSGVSTITTVGGTNATYTTGNFTTGNIVTGVVTNISGTNLNYTGIATVGSVNIGATQVISSARQLQNIASLDATTTATIESAVANAPNTFTDLNISGLSTFAGITTVTGVSLFTRQLSVSGVSTFAGIATHTASLFGTQASFSGVVTASSFRGDGSQLTGISAGGGSQWVTTASGIHTLSNVGIGTTNPTTKLFLDGAIGFVNSNIRIGSNQTLPSATGSSNISIGDFAGNPISSGTRNVFIGDFANAFGLDGSYNVMVGYRGSSQGSHNIHIGEYHAGGSGNYNVVIGNGDGANNYNFGVQDPSKDLQFAIGVNTTSNNPADSKYWLVGNEQFNVGVGTVNATSKLTVNGDTLVTGISTVGLANTSTPPSNSQMSFELISNTQLRIKVRGTDGVLRSANITLA